VVPTEPPTILPTPTRTPTPPPPLCPGDCNRDGFVSIDELVLALNIALDLQSVDACTAADGNGDGVVTIEELVRAVSSAILGCG
jgi:hypothetical protein